MQVRSTPDFCTGPPPRRYSVEVTVQLELLAAACGARNLEAIRRANAATRRQHRLSARLRQMWRWHCVGHRCERCVPPHGEPSEVPTDGKAASIGRAASRPLFHPSRTHEAGALYPTSATCSALRWLLSQRRSTANALLALGTGRCASSRYRKAPVSHLVVSLMRFTTTCATAMLHLFCAAA